MQVRKKPDISLNYQDDIVIYRNVITNEIADELIQYATNDHRSGLHRRGSKHPERCDASFSTCLVNRTDDKIYEFLDSLWEQYVTTHKHNITFIEPYEIKLYSTGDKFGYHHDGYGSLHCDVDRKINLTIQLSNESEYIGGDLCVGDIACPREFGTAIFFPSHYYHLVTEVTQGARASLIGHAWGPIIR
jgi:hypothetical protein